MTNDRRQRRCHGNHDGRAATGQAKRSHWNNTYYYADSQQASKQQSAFSNERETKPAPTVVTSDPTASYSFARAVPGANGSAGIPVCRARAMVGAAASTATETSPRVDLTARK